MQDILESAETCLNTYRRLHAQGYDECVLELEVVSGIDPKALRLCVIQHHMTLNAQELQ